MSAVCFCIAISMLAFFFLFLVASATVCICISLANLAPLFRQLLHNYTALPCTYLLITLVWELVTWSLPRSRSVLSVQIETCQIVLPSCARNARVAIESSRSSLPNIRHCAIYLAKKNRIWYILMWLLHSPLLCRFWSWAQSFLAATLSLSQLVLCCDGSGIRVRRSVSSAVLKTISMFIHCLGFMGTFRRACMSAALLGWIFLEWMWMCGGIVVSMCFVCR